LNEEKYLFSHSLKSSSIIAEIVITQCKYRCILDSNW
jgi:hypothetical protein